MRYLFLGRYQELILTRDAMHNATCAVVLCPSARLSVLTGASNAGGWNMKNRDFTNISKFTSKDDHRASYYGTPIGTRTRFIQWRHFQ